MSELVIVAIVSGAFGLAGVATTVIGGLLLNRKVNVVKEQVVNGHSSNLREEGDERHAENGGKLDEILTEIKRLRSSVGRLWERSDKHGDSIHNLELTQPRKETKDHE